MHRSFRSDHERRQLPSLDLLALAALASLASLAAGGCGGERAFKPRDGGTVTGSAGATGGARGGAGGAGGAGGSVGGDITGVAGGGAGGSAGTGDGGTGGTSVGNGGTSGVGGTGGSGGTAGRPTGPGMNGDPCTDGGECMSSWCVDGVCCANACAGTCSRCDTSGNGTCAPIADGADPDFECPMESAAMCGFSGACNGAGACRKYGPETDCDNTPMCSAAGAIVKKKVCNGLGQCVANAPQSCNGFVCSGSPPACETTCTADNSACVSGGFCSAATCVATANLAGNGNLEYGTLTGWSAASGASMIQLTTTPATVHDGQNAIVDIMRMREYQGQGYLLPTGPGIYNISAWVMQKDPNWASVPGVLTVATRCKDMTAPAYYFNFATVPMPQNTWVMVSGTVNTSTQGSADCAPASGGLIRSAQFYLNADTNTGGCTSPNCPDTYMDDLVVTVTDGHNLVGNPNFEAGAADGWGVSAPSAQQMVVTTYAHGPTHSLRLYGRNNPGAGPKYTLPIGYARYDVSLWVLQLGVTTPTAKHDLTLQSTYTCLGSNPPPSTTIMAASQVDPGVWTKLTGTVTLPPADAPAGCKMSAAGVYVVTEGASCGAECPDLYVDDVSITLK